MAPLIDGVVTVRLTAASSESWGPCHHYGIDCLPTEGMRLCHRHGHRGMHIPCQTFPDHHAAGEDLNKIHSLRNI